MENEPTDLNILAPTVAPRVNANPLQRPGQDEVLRTAVIAGPEAPGDRRVYLSVAMLAELLDIARASPMGRVQVDGAGVRVDLHSTRSGHQYEVWTLIGAKPRPEPMPASLQALGLRS